LQVYAVSNVKSSLETNVDGSDSVLVSITDALELNCSFISSSTTIIANSSFLGCTGRGEGLVVVSNAGAMVGEDAAGGSVDNVGDAAGGWVSNVVGEGV
jgi:hypothetical protein